MASRLTLNDELIEVLGNRNVYFQPPESVRMKYPCIVYKKTDIDTTYADDMVYKKINQYRLTVIDPNPDTVLPDKLLERFKMISFDTYFPNDNLNHYVLTLYY